MKLIKVITPLVIGLIISWSFPTFGQRRPPMEKIEAAKIGLISERLNLTTEQAEKFWPIYHEYSEKRRANHMEFRKLRKNYDPETATDAQTTELLEQGQKTKAKEMELEKEYSAKLLKVINAKQLLALKEAEREFKEKLLHHIEKRRQGNGYGPDQMQHRRNPDIDRNGRY